MELHLRELTRYPDRHVGGAGNGAANGMFAAWTTTCGFEVSRRRFPCLDWEDGGATLILDGATLDVHVGPYSPPCDVLRPLVAASTVDGLESGEIAGKVVLLHGEIAGSQLMPKNFPFHNPDGHCRIVRCLEERGAAAVIAATGRDPHRVGSQYPFPLFEDGDFGIPSAYVTDVEGVRLLEHAGREVALRIRSTRSPRTAENLVATKRGSTEGRIVLFAHIDSRRGSPGAIDNATGVVALLALAELLADHTQGPTVQLVPVNGEDHYDNPGEVLWLHDNQASADDILFGVNLDDIGRRGQETHVSFYGCPEDIERVVRDAMAARPHFSEGPQWFQGDHMLFGLLSRPAIAVASTGMEEFMATLCHTVGDTADLVDPGAVAGVARFLRDLISRAGELPR